MVKLLPGCGRELTGSGETYMVFSDRRWISLDTTKRSDTLKDPPRPCGGRMIHTTKAEEIRLCMECATLNGVLW